MVAVFGEHAGIAAEFQAQIRKLPDLERLLAKAVAMLMRFQRCVCVIGRRRCASASFVVLYACRSTQSAEGIGV